MKGFGQQIHGVFQKILDIVAGKLVLIFEVTDSGYRDSKNWSSVTPLYRNLASNSKNHLEEYVNSHDFVVDVILDNDSAAAFVGERLTDCGLLCADEITSRALAKYPNNVRVKFVRALYLSRNDQMEAAINMLQQLNVDGYEIIEKFGILGGAYKKLWFKSNNVRYLEESNKCYSNNKFKDKSYYLLINASATDLWLGQKNQSIGNARKVIELLAELRVTYDWAISFCLGYWIVATLAEAYLLVGKTAESFNLYVRAKGLDLSGGRWNVTRMQLAKHLQYLPQHSELFKIL